MSAIANRCRQITVLNLNYTAVTPASLAPVLLSCTHIEVLKLAGISNWVSSDPVSNMITPFTYPPDRCNIRQIFRRHRTPSQPATCRVADTQTSPDFSIRPVYPSTGGAMSRIAEIRYRFHSCTPSSLADCGSDPATSAKTLPYIELRVEQRHSRFDPPFPSAQDTSLGRSWSAPAPELQSSYGTVLSIDLHK